MIELPPEVTHLAVLVGAGAAAEGRLVPASEGAIHFARGDGEPLEVRGYRAATIAPILARAPRVEDLVLAFAGGCGPQLPSADRRWSWSGSALVATATVPTAVEVRGLECDPGDGGYWVAAGSDVPRIRRTGACEVEVEAGAARARLPTTEGGSWCVDRPPPGCEAAGPALNAAAAYRCGEVVFDFFLRTAASPLDVVAERVLTSTPGAPPAEGGHPLERAFWGRLADLEVAGGRLWVAERATGDPDCRSPEPSRIHVLDLETLATIWTATTAPCVHRLAVGEQQQVYALAGSDGLALFELDPATAAITNRVAVDTPRRGPARRIPIELFVERDSQGQDRGSVVVQHMVALQPTAELVPVWLDGRAQRARDLELRLTFYAALDGDIVMGADSRDGGLFRANLLEGGAPKLDIIAGALRGPLLFLDPDPPAPRLLISTVSGVGAARLHRLQPADFIQGGLREVIASYTDPRAIFTAMALARPGSSSALVATIDLLEEASLLVVDLSIADARSGFRGTPLPLPGGPVSRIRSVPGDGFVVLQPHSGRISRVR